MNFETFRKTVVNTGATVKMTGEIIVPQAFIEDMAATWTTSGWWRFMTRERTWEERLAEAIAQRSIRNRFRWFRSDWSDRFGVAWDALRGRHSCEGND